MKLKKVTQNDPVERLAVSVRRSTMNMLDLYRAHYQATYGEEIEKSHLVEEMLRDFMLSDKNFAKSMSSGKVEAKPEQVSRKPAKGDSAE